jgi:anthranilate/para-aminobenzoate synthase component II
VLGGELFAGVPEHVDVVRYHSLAIRQERHAERADRRCRNS